MAFIRKTYEPQPIEQEGVKDVSMQVLIGEEQDAPNCIMRRFKIECGGFSPHHRHNYEHTVYVVSGKGTLLASGEEYEIAAGDSLIVYPDEIHQFRADKGVELQFLCIVPKP